MSPGTISTGQVSARRAGPVKYRRAARKQAVARVPFALPCPAIMV